MATARLYNLARMTTATTGTGTVTLGSAVTGFLTFAQSGVEDGATVSYAIKDGNNSEQGRGVYTAAGPTLTRATVLNSTNSNNALNLTGSAEVILTPNSLDYLPNINAQTGTTYTVLATDLGKLVSHSNAGAIAVTLPQATGLFGANWYYHTVNLGAGTVTITPTTSTINGGATLVLQTGQSAYIVSDGTNYSAATSTQLASSGEAEAGTSTTKAVTPSGLLAAVTGIETIWVPAVAMYSRTTNGAATGTVETATNDNMIKSLDFDASTTEYAQFSVRMPKSWNEGTITFSPSWSHPSTTTNFGVVWALQAVAISNDDAQDVAFGTAQSSTDTGGTTDDLYIGPTSSAITIAGTPAAEDYVVFQIYRDTANGSDTLAVDARLQGITLYITTDAMTDD